MTSALTLVGLSALIGAATIWWNVRNERDEFLAHIAITVFGILYTRLEPYAIIFVIGFAAPFLPYLAYGLVAGFPEHNTQSEPAF